jgi:hypothetical protein
LAGLWQPKNASYLGLFGAASSQTFESALHALVAERNVEFGAHALGDGPIAHALRPKRLHLGERSLLVLFLDQGAILVDPPAEGPIAAEVLPGAPLVALGVANALADPLALELEEPQRDPPLLESPGSR